MVLTIAQFVCCDWTCFFYSHHLAIWFSTLERTGWCWLLGHHSTTSTSSTLSSLTRRTVWHSTIRACRYIQETLWGADMSSIYSIFLEHGGFFSHFDGIKPFILSFFEYLKSFCKTMLYIRERLDKCIVESISEHQNYTIKDAYAVFLHCFCLFFVATLFKRLHG